MGACGPTSQSGGGRDRRTHRSDARGRTHRPDRRSPRQLDLSMYRWVFVLAWLPHAPPIRQSLLHFFRRLLRIEVFGVKPTTDPLQQFLVLLMILVADRFEEIGIAPNATAIFWR